MTTTSLEVTVHRRLKELSRRLPQALPWPHQLTMARLVARSLTTGRSALIQVASQPEYRLSYLLPALSWPQPLVLALTPTVQAQLQQQDLPLVENWEKPLLFVEQWPQPDWAGVLVVDPVVLLRDFFRRTMTVPKGVPIVFDQTQHLEAWVETALGVRVEPADWQRLRLSLPPAQAEQVLHQVTELAHYLLTNPNPTQSVPQDLRRTLGGLLQAIQPTLEPWTRFTEHLVTDWPLWSAVHHQSASFTLYLSPVPVAAALAPLWSQHPVILIGEGLDSQKQAPAFRYRLGLGEMTTVQFAPDRHEEEVSLYLPDLPETNHPHFVARILPLLGQLVLTSPGPVVVLVDSYALRRQLGTYLAAQFGSRVGVGRVPTGARPVVVADWDFWEQGPGLDPATLVLVNLPFPAWDQPLVQARIHALKQEGRDWFREYLLPVALGRLQRGVNPVRRTKGLVALLDNRVSWRSYGAVLLEGLAPARRLYTLDKVD
ncbi:helicase C-terminal domain-containing protein [Candidatus Cyanaurora vandensis]|uniref:helicase C-terminal domain-containing protein n=1 Tax=Candidatus Cyanaurora vandensis TaxID=2714958 RepID=UPI00257F52D1|nr:helicase C-terminal domain-containing protein [Candidatus Cyanaurora vandensis]